MLVETKAKVGVFAIALGAYLPQFPTLVPEFEAQYDAFKKTIPDTVEMIDGGIVTTKELSMEAGDKFRAADVDLVILQLLTYATSYNMLPAVRDLNVPVVLVNVQKRKAPDYANTDTPKWLGELYACGAVGEMVADLERAGKRHAVITGVVEGGDAYVAKEIDEWCRAAQVRRRFRYTNIAQIGRPYPGMMDLYIDETNLYNRMGLYTKQFDWEKIWAIASPHPPPRLSRTRVRRPGKRARRSSVVIARKRPQRLSLSIRPLCSISIRTARPSGQTPRNGRKAVSAGPGKEGSSLSRRSATFLHKEMS